MFCLIKLSSFKDSFKYLNRLNKYLYSSTIISSKDNNLSNYINNNQVIVLNVLLDNNLNDTIKIIKRIVPQDKILYLIIEYTNVIEVEKFIISIKKYYNNYHGSLLLRNTIFNYNKKAKEKEYKIFRYKVKYNVVIE